MSFHENSKKNDLPHSLYEIYDRGRDDVFKYGISKDPIGQDGLPKRARLQISFLNNVAGWLRYVGKILIENIPGKRRASEIETDFIDRNRAENGRNPAGNRRRKS